MSTLKMESIGQVVVNQDMYRLVLKPEYRAALATLECIPHIQVLWWFNHCDNSRSRNVLTVDTPYLHAPNIVGIFATRSPERPNPIALTCCQITYVDIEKGEVGLSYIDAENGSPLLDIKPYMPSFDRLEHIGKQPDWFSNWPDSIEKSRDFDWARVFNFEN
ncbi:TrmO family methyltransferase domain-containing protein [Raoultella lignicola]|uniref:TrmO family methyltransferase n=1 Tax=Raoultella lignicola TaxID=3040939 RepID=A0ABU9F7U4_9ENTR